MLGSLFVVMGTTGVVFRTQEASSVPQPVKGPERRNAAEVSRGGVGFKTEVG